MAIVITAIEKQGPVLTFKTNDPNNRFYRVDFKKGQTFGIAGKPITTTAPILAKMTAALADENKTLCLALRLISLNISSPAYYAVVESMMSYPDLWPSSSMGSSMVRFILDKCDGKLPKGYVSWCRENKHEFSSFSIEKFYINQKMGQWPMALRESVERFRNGTGFELAALTNYDHELSAKLLRIATNSLKRYEVKDLNRTLREIINLVMTIPGLRDYLDDTKSAENALQILDDQRHKERNKAILANESKIAALNGAIVGGLMVKIPSFMKDFKDEGAQQHNCVGYMYHDSMAQGRDLIYFLRNPDAPSKSYVTCRFNMSSETTVEHRTKHNVWFENDQLFQQIDTMIKNLLRQ